MPKPRAYCPDHGSPLPPACLECVAAMQRPVGLMTADERGDELEHPVDLEAHVIGSLDQIAGTKPVVTVRLDD